jgi:predicted protein tyrosine phosphatase
MGSVIACSRSDIENKGFTSRISGNWVAVSIFSSGDSPARVASNGRCMGIFPFRFDDIDTVAEGVPLQIFDRELAGEILDTVDEWREKADTIVVQCDAGVSRSMGLAAGICKHLGIPDDYFFAHGVPNMLVYRTVLQESFRRKYNERKIEK